MSKKTLGRRRVGLTQTLASIQWSAMTAQWPQHHLNNNKNHIIFLFRKSVKNIIMIRFCFARNFKTVSCCAFFCQMIMCWWPFFHLKLTQKYLNKKRHQHGHLTGQSLCGHFACCYSLVVLHATAIRRHNGYLQSRDLGSGKSKQTNISALTFSASSPNLILRRLSLFSKIKW